MRLRAMRRWSRVTSGSMPAVWARASQARATGQSSGAGRRMRGGGQPEASATKASTSRSGGFLARKNVALADGAALERERVALGDVVDMDDAEAGVDVGGHAAGGGVGDHAAGWGGLDVARADGGGGVDDDGGQPLFAHQAADGLFGGVFGALVDADDGVGDHWRDLVGRRAVGGEAEGGDGTAVDDALDAGGERGARRRASVPATLAASMASGSGTQMR